MIIFLAMCFGLAMEGASKDDACAFDLSAAPVISGEKNCIHVNIYDEKSEQNHKKILCCGQWDMSGVQINDVLIEEEILTVANKLYDCPGKSCFLEALMDEMRKSGCAGPRFTRLAHQPFPPLSEGIQGVESGLTWLTTYLPSRSELRSGGYERERSLLATYQEQREVVRMRLQGLIISGFVKREDFMKTTDPRASMLLPCSPSRMAVGADSLFVQVSEKIASQKPVAFVARKYPDLWEAHEH